MNPFTRKLIRSRSAREFNFSLALLVHRRLRFVKELENADKKDSVHLVHSDKFASWLDIDYENGSYNRYQ